MENSQTFNIPLDAPIDFDSADMLSVANDPTLSLNRQQYQGSVLPNSLRYEHDGYFAGNHAHEFNHVAGNSIKDSTGVDYAVKKHQAYYAPVYHITSGDVSFDYYPLTTVIQSNEPATIINKDGSIFDVDFGSTVVHIDKDTAACTGDNITVESCSFDTKLFTFDIAIVNNNETIDEHDILTFGKDIDIGLDTFYYSFSNDVHNWGDQFTYNGIELSAADGNIGSVTEIDNRLLFDYILNLESVDTLQVVTDVSYAYKYDHTTIETTLDPTIYGITAYENRSYINMPLWYSVSVPLINNQSDDTSVKLPTLLDNEGTRFNAIGDNKLHLRVRGSGFMNALRYHIQQACKNSFNDNSITTVFIDFKDPYYSYRQCTENTQFDAYTATLTRDQYIDDNTFNIIFNFSYNSMFTVFYLEDISVDVYACTSNDINTARYIFNLHNIYAPMSIYDYTELSRNEWHSLSERSIKDVSFINDLPEIDNSYYTTSPAEITVIKKPADKEGIDLSNNDRVDIAGIFSSDYLTYTVYNSYEEIEDIKNGQFSREEQFKLRDPCVRLKFRDVDFCDFCVPWVTFYKNNNAIYTTDELCDIAQYTLTALNGKEVTSDNEKYYFPTHIEIPNGRNIMSLSIRISCINVAQSKAFKEYVVNNAREVPASENITDIENYEQILTVFIINGKEYFIDGTFEHGYLEYNCVKKQIDIAEDPANIKHHYIDVTLCLLYNTHSEFMMSGSSGPSSGTVSIYALHYEPVTVGTHIKITLGGVQVYRYFCLSNYLRSILKEEVVSKLDAAIIPGAFYRIVGPLLYDEHTIGLINQDAAISNITTWVNSPDAPDNWDLPYTGTFLLKDNNNFIAGKQPMYVEIALRYTAGIYFALLISNSIMVNVNVDGATITSDVSGGEDNGYVTLSDKSLKVDAINKTAEYTVALNCTVYNNLTAGLPTEQFHLPEYIMKGSLSYAYVSNEYYEVASVDNKNSTYYIKYIYELDPTYSITSATVITDTKWYHGLSNSLSNKDVSFNINSVSVTCNDTRYSYNIQFDQKTQEATCIGSVMFKQDDIGKYTITKNKQYVEQIQLYRAMNSNNALHLTSVLDGIYTLQYDSSDIVLNTKEGSATMNSTFGNYNIENAVFNDSDVQFDLYGKKLYTATVTVKDIYNLQNIQRVGVTDEEITFDR